MSHWLFKTFHMLLTLKCCHLTSTDIHVSSWFVSVAVIAYFSWPSPNQPAIWFQQPSDELADVCVGFCGRTSQPFPPAAAVIRQQSNILCRASILLFSPSALLPVPPSSFRLTQGENDRHFQRQRDELHFFSISDWKEKQVLTRLNKGIVSRRRLYAAVLVCRYIFKEEFETQKQNNPIKSTKETHGELIVLAIIKICS